ncbi:MAG: hypothetical protein IKV61_04340 [Clostridia bacterium]|nr:hypothetical protein [Clostridia bacterium]
MATKRKGIFTRLIEGPERSEDYARKTLPKNRWSLAVSIFTTNFTKLIKINLLILLFVFPIFLALFFREALISSQATNSPFSQNLGFGYPFMPTLQGREQEIIVYSNTICNVLIVLLSFIASVGISGGIYVMRNMVWTEGVFVGADFWIGVKKNYKWVMLTTLAFTMFLSLTIFSINLSDYQIALSSEWDFVFVISKIVSYVLIAFFTCVYVYMLTMGVTYKITFWQNFRNAVILSFGLLPLNIAFFALGALPLLLLFTNIGSITFAIGIMLVIFISISFFFLVFTNYSHWAFDEFINDRVAGAKKYRGIYKQSASKEVEHFVYKKSNFAKKPIKPITDTEIEIAVLPESYSRNDLIKLQESKDRMIEDSAEYEREHMQEYLDLQNEVNEFMNDDSGEGNEVSTAKEPQKSKKKKGKK